MTYIHAPLQINRRPTVATAQDQFRSFCTPSRKKSAVGRQSREIVRENLCVCLFIYSTIDPTHWDPENHEEKIARFYLWLRYSRIARSLVFIDHKWATWPVVHFRMLVWQEVELQMSRRPEAATAATLREGIEFVREVSWLESATHWTPLHREEEAEAEEEPWRQIFIYGLPRRTTRISRC